MKSIIYYIAFFCIVSLFSCTKNNEVELIIGDPKERINDTVNMVKSTLVGEANGWKAYTTTESGKEFSFYMSFAENDRIKMFSDINSLAAATVEESTYRVRQIMAATLVFDTYNYITVLQDPNGAVNGGKNGVGLGSDVEYEYKRRSGDSIIFKGRKFDKPLVLVKATAAEAKQYQEGDLAKSMQATDFSMGLSKNPFITVGGKEYNLSINNLGKVFSLFYADNTGKPITKSADYFYTLDGVELMEGMEYEGIIFKALVIKGGKYFLVTQDKKEYEVKERGKTPFPLYELFGLKYADFVSPFRKYFPGNSPDGLTILRRYHEGLVLSHAGFPFNYGTLAFKMNKATNVIKIDAFHSQNNGTSGWTTTYEFNYVYDSAAETFALKLKSGPTGGYVSSIMDQLVGFLTTSKFKLTAKEIDGLPCVIMQGVEKPNVEMVFQLR